MEIHLTAISDDLARNLFVSSQRYFEISKASYIKSRIKIPKLKMKVLITLAFALIASLAIAVREDDTNEESDVDLWSLYPNVFTLGGFES